MACSVVCISRAVGAGGEEIGRLVAERLGFTYADEEVVAQAAARGGVDAGTVADEEAQRSRATRLLEALALSGSVAMVAPVPARGEDELTGPEIRELIRDAIEHMAAQGHVAIVAHAASHALSGRPEVLRVLITASAEVRAQRIADAEGIDGARAVRDSDAGRRDYLKRFYDVKEELPTQYDLVVCTDVLTPARAAQIISLAAQT